MPGNSKPRKPRKQTLRSAFKQVPTWLRAPDHSLAPLLLAMLNRAQALIEGLDGNRKRMTFIEILLLARVFDVNAVLYKLGQYEFDLQPFLAGIDIVGNMLTSAAAKGDDRGVDGYELPEVTRLVLLNALKSCMEVWRAFTPAEQVEAWEATDERARRTLVAKVEANAAI